MMNYYEGNEKNENQIIEETNDNIKLGDINLKINLSPDFNYQVMNSKHNSQVDLEKAQLEAQKLLAEGNIDQLMGDKFI